MNIFTVFQNLRENYPERKPGSSGASSVISKIKNLAAPWGVPVITEKVPVYYLKKSIVVFSILSLLAIGLGLLTPLTGLIAQLILNVLLLLEIIHPVLARIIAGQGENLMITIPARSKETQKVLVVTGYSSDSFIEPSPKINTRLYLGLMYLLSLFVLTGQILYFAFPAGVFPPLSFIFTLGMISLVFLPKTTDTSNISLNNCALLTELGAILVKTRPMTTTVHLLFSGSHSLNSGVIKIPKMLKTGPELTYVINLINLPDKRINVVTKEGVILPKDSDPVLVELLMETAREKDIHTQELKSTQITEAYPLKFKKLKAVTITNPLINASDSNSDKDLREILTGVIRKIDLMI
jgi:hypothetical protein